MAHNYSTQSYSFNFPAESEIMEITYIEKGNMTRELSNGNIVTIPQGHISIFYHDRESNMSGTGFHSHSTVILKMKYNRIPIKQENLEEEYKFSLNTSVGSEVSVLLPDYMEIGEENQVIEAYIKKIILQYSLSDHFKNAWMSYAAIELMHIISHEAVKKFFAQKDGYPIPSNIYYCNSAMNYINRNISVPMSIVKIAEAMGITENYLCNVFKSVTGMTLVKYINNKKIALAKELLDNHGLSRKEICDNIGITEENYLSRLFKNNTGMSLSDYKKMKGLKFKNEKLD
ncbi:MAG: response regulator [Clostridia bacterium]|nr:response regulator [Clostridia bacterium]